MLDPTVTSLIPFGVVAASLAGSPHCAMMCGPLTLVIGTRKAHHLVFHFGRLLAYVFLGAVAGALGETVLGSEALSWVSWTATIVMALGFLLAALQVLRGGQLHLPLPAPLQGALNRLWQWNSDSVLRPVTLGAASVLLPCGWLYTFVMGAAATQSPWKGGFFLFAFWLGTLPALAGSQLVTRAFHKLRIKAPLATGVLLISLAIISISARVRSHSHGAEHRNESHSHGEHHEQSGTH